MGNLMATLDRIRATLRVETNSGRQEKSAEIAEKERRLEIERQLEGWQNRGVTKRYYGATWGNWAANTPQMAISLETAKQAWNKNLFFTGRNGTGKTHLAMCLAKDGATYRRLFDIFREVRSDFGSESDALDFYGGRKLLVIDEVGRQKFSGFEENLVFEIIDRRWHNILPTTVVTNMSVHEFTEFYGKAVIDRLRPVVVHFEWESKR